MRIDRLWIEGASPECARTLVANELHRIAANAASVFMNFVIFDGDHLDRVLFQELSGFLRSCVHDHSPRFDCYRVGREKFDFLAWAFD